jgi:hypothetical protein
MPLSLKLSVQGRNGLFLYGQSTAATFWQEKMLEILSTENPTLMLYQTNCFGIKRLSTMVTLQVSNVILFSESFHAFLMSSKRLITASELISVGCEKMHFIHTDNCCLPPRTINPLFDYAIVSFAE